MFSIKQEATAISFEKEIARLDQDECYFNSISPDLVDKRDFMVKFLCEAGMKPTIPEGGYFILADWSPLESQIDLSSEKDEHKDYRFTKWMTKNVGLQGIPPSAFYGNEHKYLAEDYVRYCFFKVRVLVFFCGVGFIYFNFRKMRIWRKLLRFYKIGRLVSNKRSL